MKKNIIVLLTFLLFDQNTQAEATPNTGISFSIHMSHPRNFLPFVKVTGALYALWGMHRLLKEKAPKNATSQELIAFQTKLEKAIKKIWVGALTLSIGFLIDELLTIRLPRK